MLRTIGIVAAVPSILTAQQGSVQTPAPQDISQPMPGDVGLAGSAMPDSRIAAFLERTLDATGATP